MNNPTTIDRLPPHSVEAEQATLGCMLQDPKKVGNCIERLKGAKDTFYDLRHQNIYEIMVELWDENQTFDLVTLQERLKAWGMLEQVGGITYLVALPDAAPSAENIDYYIDIINEKFLARQMIRICTETVGRIYDFEGDMDAMLDDVERQIMKAAESRIELKATDIKTVVREAITEIEYSVDRKGAVTGISTGFSDLDRMTNGLQQGAMWVLAARPGIGKTSYAMNIVENVSVNQKIPVGVFSLEMTARELVKRMICSRARVNSASIRDGFLADRDYPKITNAAGRIAAAPLQIDDTGGLSIMQIRAKARRMWQQFGIKLVVIDYMQLANSLGSKRRFESRQQEVAEISQGCKNLAKELNIPVLVLSQLNRDLEREKNRKPRLSDLRESGSIEQDADLVAFLYKRSSDEDEDDETESVPVSLLIAKQRGGPTGEIPMTFFRQFTRFELAAKVSDEDVPQYQDQQQEFAP